VATKFALTAAVCGLATVVWASALSSRSIGSAPLITIAALMVVKLAVEGIASRDHIALLTSSQLLPTTLRRLTGAIAGGVVLPIALAGRTFASAQTPWFSVAGTSVALALIVWGELGERSLFFTTASPPR